MIEDHVVPLLPNLPGDKKRKAAGGLAGGSWVVEMFAHHSSGVVLWAIHSGGGWVVPSM